jgi:hypothetical protein
MNGRLVRCTERRPIVSARQARRRSSSGVPALLLSLLAACGGGGPVAPEASGTNESSPAAGGALAVDAVSFERWLRVEAGVEPKEIDPQARVSLWREYLAELLFAREAQARQLVVPDDALDRELARLEALGDAWSGEQRQAAARQKLLAVIYESQVLQPMVKVEDAEVDAALAQAGVESQPGVSFRMIRTESRSVIDQAQRRIEQGEAFEIVARELTTAPDQGAVMQRRLADLPKQAAGVLRSAEPGRLAGPVEISEAWYLFQLVAHVKDADPQGDRRRATARESLERQRFELLREQALQTMATAAGLALDQPPAAAAEKP